MTTTISELTQRTPRDCKEKLAEYQNAGIREYWLIDPDKRMAEFYELGDDGTYFPAPLMKMASTIQKSSPIIRLKVDWFWQSPMLATPDISRELKVNKCSYRRHFVMQSNEKPLVST